MENENISQENVVPSAEPQAETTQSTNAAPTKKRLKWWLWVIIGVGGAAILTALGLLIASLFNTDSEKPDMELIPICKNEKWGYINQKGEIVINPQFEDATYFCDGLARVENSKGKIGYINKKGEYAIPAKYKRGTYFREGLAFVVAEGEAPICINKKGKIIFKLTQADGVSEFSEGLAAFYSYDKEGKARYGYVDKKGRVAINVQFASASSFREGMAVVLNNDGDYGYINKKGEYVINPQFDDANEFNEGLAAVQMGEDWGFIDKKGKYVINPQFDDALIFYNGYAAVLQGDKWGFVDKKGKFTINPQFDAALGFLFDEPYSLVVSNDKIGYVDKDGKYAINPQFEQAYWFVDGITIAKSGKKYGLINKKGEYIVNPQFDAIEMPCYNFGIIESDYYDCSELFNTFMKRFDSQHVDRLKSGVRLGEITALKDLDIHQFGITSVHLPADIKLNKDITLEDITYDFSDRTYFYTDDWFSLERVPNGEAELEMITYELALNEAASRKSETIAGLIANKLQKIYNGSIVLKERVFGYTALICAKDFYIIVESYYDTIEVTAIFDKTEFDEIKKEFTQTEEDLDGYPEMDDEPETEEAYTAPAPVAVADDEYWEE